MAKAAKPRKPAPRAKRTALSDESPIEVQPGDVLVSLDEDTNFLFQTKTREFRAISQMQRNSVTEHYADAQSAVRKRPIVVPLACRRMEDYKSSRGRVR